MQVWWHTYRVVSGHQRFGGFCLKKPSRILRSRNGQGFWMIVSITADDCMNSSPVQSEGAENRINEGQVTRS